MNNNITGSKINESHLYTKYKSSYKSAFIDLSLHTLLLSSSYYVLWLFRTNWLSIFTIPLLALLNVKTFIIFHDCGHQSYTPNKILNYVIGIIMGIMITTPFSWNFNHNTHHLVNGNMNNNYNYPYNETIFNSLKEYKNMSLSKRQIYKFIRNPYIFFSIIPILNFLVKLRFNAFTVLYINNLSIKNMNTFIIIEQILNNIGIFILIFILYKYNILVHWLFTAAITSSIGFMTFHSQHGFNPPYIVNNETFSQKDSGLKGSSYIQIPYLLKYFTGGIEYHHIHHMNSKIPGYNLQAYHEEVISNSNMFDNVVKLSMVDCYNNLWLVLYDEDKNKYITFKEADKAI